MKERPSPLSMLMADDDPDDRLMVSRALETLKLAHNLQFVEDGEQLMDYLHRHGRYAPPALAPRPGLVLLDLNMPKMDGREALREIKSDQRLRRIPIVVLTTSKAQEVVRSYELGVNSYISKPTKFDELVTTMKAIGQYWFETVELPSGEK